MKKTRLLSLFCLLSALGACDTMAPTPKVAEPDVVSLRLAEASEKAANALDAMSKVEQVRGPAITQDDFSGAPPELQQPITITWVGPLEKIAPLLATRAGYHYVEIGAPPPVPITVRLDLYNAPLIKAIADIGTQAGQKANIQLDSNQRSLEVKYAPSDMMPPSENMTGVDPFIIDPSLSPTSHLLTPPPGTQKPYAH